MNEPKRYNIVVSPAAERDMDSIAEYLNSFSERTAMKRLYEFDEAIDSLREMPLRCPLAGNEPYAKKGYHYLVVYPYLVFFTVSGNTVRIRRVIDGRSNYK